MEPITYKHMGGEQWFTFQCDKTGCGTLSEEGKPCPRCGHTVMKVYAKIPQVLKEDKPDWEEAFNILSGYWDSIDKEQQEIAYKELEATGIPLRGLNY